MRFTLILLLSLWGASASANANAPANCLLVKAAFDIGSGTTKMKVAQVNVCEQRIIKVLLEDDQQVSYKEALEASKNNMLEDGIIEQGAQALARLKEKALAHSPALYEGVATSAFRTAVNGELAVKKLSEKTGVKISLVSQEDEAKLGFVAAASMAKSDLKEVLVWDIGGGSMQMISYNGEGKFDIYLGKLASVSFKRKVVEEAKGLDPALVESPNPIGPESGKKALELARESARKSVPPSIKEKISGGAEVVGIGGVHYYSILGRLGKDKSEFTSQDLAKTLESAVNLRDSDIPGGYAATDISNLLLVKGFMDELKIEKVRAGQLNLADGILLGGVAAIRR